VEALSGQQVVQINCGDNHAAACTYRGFMLTWGNNDKGQLGIQFPVPTASATPKYVPEFSKTGCFVVVRFALLLLCFTLLLMCLALLLMCFAFLLVCFASSYVPFYFIVDDLNTV
jgi:Regulator of chromosome condensation (RCC1) repeat